MPPMRHHEPTVSSVRRPSYSYSAASNSSSSSSRRVSVTRLPLAPLSAQEMASNYAAQPPSAGPSSSSSAMPPSKARRRSSRQDEHRRSSLPTAPRLAKPILTAAPDLPAFDPRVHDNLASYSFGAPPPPSTAGSDDTDDDDRSHRAKMRAIDDGSRRPSLPINIPRRDSAGSRRRLSRQIDDDGDDIMAGPSTDVPRSEPGLRSFRLRSQLVAQTAASGFDLNYILGTSSYPPSVASVHSRESDQFRIRDDSFARFVSKNDPEYTRRRALWSFRPERGSPPMSPIAREKSPEGSVPPDQHEAEIWACESVGRYCVWPNRQEITSGDGVATRRPVVIRHLTERREEERGPSVIIHKHSKVKAFSVFRGYHLPGTKIPASTAILIATKAVHVSDTSHNGSNNFAHKASRSRIEREARSRAAAEESSAESQKRIRGHTVTNSGSSDRAAGKAKATPPPNDTLDGGHSPQPPTEVPPSEELPHMRKSHAVAFDSLDPSLVDHVLSRATPASIGEKLKRAFGNKPPGAVPSGGPIVPNQVEGSYVPPWMLMAPESLKHEEQRIIRNLNASFRAVGLIPPPKPRGSVSSESKNKRLSGSGGSSGNLLPSSLPKSPVLEEIPDDAMCMVLPLWPSSNGPSSPGDVDGPPVGYQTPLADRQYLLVYYVPIPENEPSPSPAPVDKGKNREMSPPPPPPPSASKKRSRQQRASEAVLSPDPSASSPGRRGTPTRRQRGDPAKQAFKIIARMVTYAEVRECGLRLPRTGLSVTGVLSDALIGNPLYHASTPNFSTVIGVCTGRDSGIEFDPEGLDNLGLRSTPIGSRLPPPQSAPLSVTLTGTGANLVVRAGSPTSIAPMSSESLSVIGRAVLELTWSGCIALFEHGFP